MSALSSDDRPFVLSTLSFSTSWEGANDLIAVYRDKGE